MMIQYFLGLINSNPALYIPLGHFLIAGPNILSSSDDMIMALEFLQFTFPEYWIHTQDLFIFGCAILT